MIRTGVAVVVLGALLCLYTATMPDTPPQAGANIGAGILALLSLSVLTVGMVLVAIGIVRRLLLRRKRSTSSAT